MSGIEAVVLDIMDIHTGECMEINIGLWVGIT